MNAVIIGGGKVGWYLVKTLVARGHSVTVVDDDPRACERLAAEFNITVICGDGTSLRSLADAGAERAGVLVAVTGQDEENLVACQLAKRMFSVPKTIARVNNPKNERAFHALGVNEAVSSTSIIAGLIEREAVASSIKTLFTFQRGDLQIVEVDIEASSAAVGLAVKDMRLPEHCVLVSVIRGESVIIPRGDTVLEAGDVVLALTSPDRQEALNRALGGRKRRS